MTKVSELNLTVAMSYKSSKNVILMKKSEKTQKVTNTQNFNIQTLNFK